MEQTLEESVYLLNRSMRELGRIYGKMASKLSLSESAFWILYALSDPHREYSQTMISEEWSIPKQTVHSSMEYLMEKDLVYVEPICLPNHHRRQMIRLTSSGKRFVEEYILNFRKAEQQIISGMTEEERCTYISFVQNQMVCMKEVVNGFINESLTHEK